MRRIRPPIERFRVMVDVPDDGCWMWTGPKVPPWGYGKFTIRQKQMYAHRYIYETFIGPIPEGYQIDHLCRTPSCVNPTHLEAVTSRENLLRGNTVTARNASRTHCPQGHEYNQTNTFVTTQGCRLCRVCDRDRHRAKREARR